MKRGRWIACLLPLLAVCRPEAAGAEYAAFAAAVAELAVDPARRAELGTRARARGAELPDEREVAEELAGLYTELVSAQVG